MAAELVYNHPMLGVALGGGAARGAAHIGALTVLERAGIIPDIIVGTSVGAVIGAAYAAGVPLAEISERFHTARWSSLARFARPGALSLLSLHPLEALLQESLGTLTFADLRFPFAAVACDLVTGARVILDSGAVAPAVRASLAIPGLFPPVVRGEQVLVDGGVVDDLPVEVTHERGAHIVLAVDLYPPPTGNHRPARLSEVLLTAWGLWSRGNHPRPDPTTCAVEPDIGRYSPWDFTAISSMEEAGRLATEYALPDLLQLLQQFR